MVEETLAARIRVREPVRKSIENVGQRPVER